MENQGRSDPFILPDDKGLLMAPRVKLDCSMNHLRVGPEAGRPRP
jgi:hypothetical protein